jgi:enoyl-CoA hydratase
MNYETLMLEKRDHVYVVTLNRPQRLNALNNLLFSELTNVVNELEADNECKSVIITGSGRGFCPGVDIREGVDPKEFSFFNYLEAFPKPTIAAINGICVGGGFELALACDFRISSQSAKYGMAEVKLGVIPGGGGTARLPRLIGPGNAKKMLYFGEMVNAELACQMGMVNEVVPAGDLMAVANNWAGELAKRPPLSLKMLKECVNLGMQMSVGEAVDYEAKCLGTLLKTEDCMEGMCAFAEKRAPVFKGK